LSVAVQTVTLASVVPEMTELPDEIALEPGEETTIFLPSRAGAGYVWEAEVEDESVVEATVKFESVDDAAVGARTFSENELLTLRGIAEGTTRVRLVQRRTWEESVEPQAAHTLTVNVAAPTEATERGGT
jgi:predicted secreted protein